MIQRHDEIGNPHPAWILVDLRRCVGGFDFNFLFTGAFNYGYDAEY